MADSVGDHMRHHSYSLPKKMKFPKFADGRTYGRTDGKKVTPKDPLHINARDLKMKGFRSSMPFYEMSVLVGNWEVASRESFFSKTRSCESLQLSCLLKSASYEKFNKRK